MLLFLNFYEEEGNKTIQPKRPTSSKQYQDYDFMDLKSPKDTLDLLNALYWIGKQYEVKDLIFMRDVAKHLMSLQITFSPRAESESEDSVGEF